MRLASAADSARATDEVDLDVLDRRGPGSGAVVIDDVVGHRGMQSLLEIPVVIDAFHDTCDVTVAKRHARMTPRHAVVRDGCTADIVSPDDHGPRSERDRSEERRAAGEDEDDAGIRAAGARAESRLVDGADCFSHGFRQR